MATKLGSFLGVFTGWVVWRSVGGIPGLVLATLVIPLVTAVITGALTRGKAPVKDESV